MTPAVTAAKRAGIDFEVLEYDVSHAAEPWGTGAARALGIEPERVFKTLVVDLAGASQAFPWPHDSISSPSRGARYEAGLDGGAHRGFPSSRRLRADRDWRAGPPSSSSDPGTASPMRWSPPSATGYPEWITMSSRHRLLLVTVTVPRLRPPGLLPGSPPR